MDFKAMPRVTCLPHRGYHNAFATQPACCCCCSCRAVLVSLLPYQKELHQWNSNGYQELQDAYCQRQLLQTSHL